MQVLKNLVDIIEEVDKELITLITIPLTERSHKLKKALSEAKEFLEKQEIIDTALQVLTADKIPIPRMESQFNHTSHESWVLFEAMGYVKICGVLTRPDGAYQIDQPAINDVKAKTKIFGLNALYCMTPMSKEEALDWLNSSFPKQVSYEPNEVYYGPNDCE